MDDPKTAPTPPRTAAQAAPAPAVSAEERRRMIAEAAYYKALTRQLEGNADPVADWLEAETEIDRQLRAGP